LLAVDVRSSVYAVEQLPAGMAAERLVGIAEPGRE